MHAHLHPISTFFLQPHMLCCLFLMILFRRKYPQWIFDFNVGMLRFMQRVMVYCYFMTDQYPIMIKINQCNQYGLSTAGYIKSLVAIHQMVFSYSSLYLFARANSAHFCYRIVWFAILFGRYPKMFFDFNMGVMQWWVRVTCYAGLLITDTLLSPYHKYHKC